MSTIKFKSGITVEAENIRRIVVEDVRDLQLHYGNLLAAEIESQGANASVYGKMFNDCNAILGLLENLEERPAIDDVKAIETKIIDYHSELAVEVFNKQLSTEAIDAHPITQKIVELEAMLDDDRVDALYERMDNMRAFA
jgi:hypothetical protein